MSKIGVVAKLTAQAGKRDELVAALDVALKNVETEEGTVRYILHTDNANEDLVWFYEQYTDDAAFAAHGSSEGMRAVGKAVAPFAAARPEIMVMTVVGGKGI